MSQRGTSRREAGEAGQALVEFALVLPILVALLFGILELSRAYNYWNKSTQVANTAARYASVARNPDPSVSLADYMKAQSDVPGSTVCISLGTGVDPGTVGRPVTARVKSTFVLLKLIENIVGSPSLAIKGTATMRIERQAPASGIIGKNTGADDSACSP